ncbi:hypothetical protein ACJX0J_015946, partial [Zea mays]
VDPSKPWAGLPIHIPKQAQALFEMAVTVTIGNGDITKFWTDKILIIWQLINLLGNCLLMDSILHQILAFEEDLEDLGTN